jgi:hypothetical protein
MARNFDELYVETMSNTDIHESHISQITYKIQRLCEMDCVFIAFETYSFKNAMIVIKAALDRLSGRWLAFGCISTLKKILRLYNMLCKYCPISADDVNMSSSSDESTDDVVDECHTYLTEDVKTEKIKEMAELLEHILDSFLKCRDRVGGCRIISNDDGRYEINTAPIGGLNSAKTKHWAIKTLTDFQHKMLMEPVLLDDNFTLDELTQATDICIELIPSLIFDINTPDIEQKLDEAVEDINYNDYHTARVVDDFMDAHAAIEIITDCLPVDVPKPTTGWRLIKNDADGKYIRRLQE